MFSSIFQMMGFPAVKPVESRAIETQQSQPSKAQIESASATAPGLTDSTQSTPVNGVHKQLKPARRQEVKAQSVKAKVATKAIPKAVKVSVTAKAAVKPAVKKPAPAQLKPPARVVPVKVVKPVAKAAKPEVKAVKPVAKVKIKLKEPVNTTIAKASKPEAVVKKPKVTHSVKPGTLAAAALPSKPAVVVAPVVVDTSASGVPARAGRPSSRLAQLTVPSMAQSVASTAAKASFTQTVEAPIISPPLASSVKRDLALANNWKSKPVEQLTDAELIAMPDDAYMNDTQMAYFRQKLVKLKLEILSNAGETTEHLREETVVVPDPTDRATIEEEHALEVRTRDRERKLLKKIEQSIGRIDSGEYCY